MVSPYVKVVTLDGSGIPYIPDGWQGSEIDIVESTQIEDAPTVDEPRSVVKVTLRDTTNGKLLCVRRLDRYTYMAPSGHSAHDIARSLEGQDDRYTYVGAEIIVPARSSGESDPRT
jgi:hypothetical protein